MAAKLPDSTARLPVAGRENEYIVTLDVFHQMHCLVSLDDRLKDSWLMISPFFRSLERGQNGIVQASLR